MGIRIVAAHLVGDAHGVARTAEVRVADGKHADDAVLARVASADAERARTLLLDIPLDDHGVRIDARYDLRADFLEKAEVIHALPAALRLLRVERLADLLPHLAQDDIVFRLLIALDLEALDGAFVDLDGQVAVLIDVEVGDLRENIAVSAIALLDFLHVAPQLDAVQKLACPQRHKREEVLRLFHCIARDLQAFEHRILEQMIGEHDALRHLLEGGEEIIVIARIQQGRHILIEARRGILVSRMEFARLLRCRTRCIRRAVELDVDDRLALVLLLVSLDGLLGRTELRPVADAVIAGSRCRLPGLVASRLPRRRLRRILWRCGLLRGLGTLLRCSCSVLRRDGSCLLLRCSLNILRRYGLSALLRGSPVSLRRDSRLRLIPLFCRRYARQGCKTRRKCNSARQFSIVLLCQRSNLP